MGDAPGACAQCGHSLGPAVPWHHPGQCHLLGGCLELLGEAGRKGMGRDVRDWGSSTVAKWRRKLSAPPSPASGLRGVSTCARGPAVLCSSPCWCPGKGNGAGWCHHIGHSICCQQRLSGTCLLASSPLSPDSQTGTLQGHSLCGPLQSSQAEGIPAPIPAALPAQPAATH